MKEWIIQLIVLALVALFRQVAETVIRWLADTLFSGNGFQ
jgi:hypothetical protein